MRVVVALGGNALLPRGTQPDEQPQVEQVARVARPLADLAAQHEVVLVHGNGPQVGLLALESAADSSLVRPYPLDDLVAETQGLIGYWIQQALGRHLTKPVVTLVSQTLVDAHDPAFATPTKFVGSSYDEIEARRLADRYGWTIAPDGDHWRRVVASPEPISVLETGVARSLLERGVTVVVAGGGGIPVVQTDGGLIGVEAVVDKDLVAARLAADLQAEALVVLTDVDHVMRDYGTPRQQPLHDVTPADLDPAAFPAGSMGPKVAAVSWFVSRTGGRAAIGSLEHAAEVFAGSSGTQVRPETTPTGGVSDA